MTINGKEIKLKKSNVYLLKDLKNDSLQYLAKLIQYCKV